VARAQPGLAPKRGRIGTSYKPSCRTWGKHCHGSLMCSAAANTATLNALVLRSPTEALPGFPQSVQTTSHIAYRHRGISRTGLMQFVRMEPFCCGLIPKTQLLRRIFRRRNKSIRTSYKWSRNKAIVDLRQNGLR
jgi:Tfp pilus assembly protein FimT